MEIFFADQLQTFNAGVKINNSLLEKFLPHFFCLVVLRFNKLI